MMFKKSVIPASQALALLTTAACSPDPVVGTWDVTSFDYAGPYSAFTFDLSEAVSTNTYGGVLYESFLDLQFQIDKEGGGSMDFVQTDFEDGTQVDTSAYSYTFVGTRVERGSWDIVVSEFYELGLSCVADGDAMTCAGTNEQSQDYDYTLVRAAE